MLHLPTPMLMGAPQGKTYDDFVAHITTLATGGNASWGSFVSDGGAYWSTAGAATGTMYGSSWLTYLWRTFAPCRLVQHGLPSPAAFNDQVSNDRRVFFRLTYAGKQSDFFGVSRNGYSSMSDSGPEDNAVYCTELIRWDGSKAWKSNPSVGSAETEYIW